MFRTLLPAIIVAAFIAAFSKPAHVITESSLDHHIRVLASDSLEGREVGEPGEWKAAAYISSEFAKAGLETAGDNDSWLQAFEFTKQTSYGSGNALTVDGQRMTLREDFIPLPHSANGTFTFSEIVDAGYGITSQDSLYDDYKGLQASGKAILIRRHSPPDSVHPHVDFRKYESLNDKITLAIDNKAAAIIFITPTRFDDTLPGITAMRVAAKEIPIVYLRQAALKRLGYDPDQPNLRAIQFTTDLVRARDTGYNVIAILPGQSDTSIVIGAHYDHLGYGEHSSLYAGKERLIHYGADDNASGTGGLIELAKYFHSRRDLLRHSIVFAAFSGEESGILGSNYYVKQRVTDPAKVFFMLNMDMIGRLSDTDSGLAVFGTGTAEAFKSYFAHYNRPGLNITFKEPGTGPSDHTAFYNAGVPVLHFFTGAHADYHRPTDTYEKIDLPGTVKVLDMIADVVTHFDTAATVLAFQKTKSDATGFRGSFSVTLGIMPDYISDVKGLRVDGVSPDRPAERAGIKRGDVIIQLGSYKIEDIGGYMSALSKFRKGDSALATIVRESDTLNLKVEFR